MRLDDLMKRQARVIGRGPARWDGVEGAGQLGACDLAGHVVARDVEGVAAFMQVDRRD